MPRGFGPWPVSRLAVAMFIGTTANAFGETAVEFDLSVVQARGLDPKLAEYFRTAPRFTAGQSRVALRVNGVSAGQVLTTFDEQGRLCLDAALLEQAGIDEAFIPYAASTQCAMPAETLAGVQVQLDPGTQQVSLLVPTGLLRNGTRASKTWTTGGTAGVVNYTALVSASAGPAYSSQFRHVGVEWGFNANDWVVRSRQSYTRSNDASQVENLYTHASRTLERYQATVQVGQLTLRSPLFAGGAFTGIQMLPEAGLAQRFDGQLGDGTQVEGIAYGPARVEVRQSGALIHTTLVPSGPFVLRDVPLLSGRLDLEVSVIEDGAEPRRFWVPVDSLRPLAIAASPGFALAAGQVRRFADDTREKPSFAVGSKDWLLSPSTLLTGGWMGAGDYQSLGLGVQHALGRDTTVSAQHLGSHVATAGSGHSLNAAVNTSLGAGVSAGLTWTRRSQGFRALDDVALDARDSNPYERAEQQWGASLSYSDQAWGALTSSVSQYRLAGAADRTSVNVAWSRAFADASLSLSVRHDSGGDDRGIGVYTSLTLPFGHRRVSVSARHDERQGTRTGARYNEHISDTASYSLAADRSDTGRTDLSARLSLLPRYTSVELGHARGGLGQRSYDLSLNGGLALHAHGVTPSPYAVRDTFGVIKVGEGAGVKVNTPQGPVWTDSSGHAVAASLPAFSASRLEVDPRSLKRNTDVLNGFREIEAGRGAVPRVEFALASARRLLLRVRTDAGGWVPKGGAVYDSATGAYLTNVVDAGLVYLADAPEQLKLYVSMADDRRCVIELDTRRIAQTAAPYQSAETTCSQRSP